MKIYITEKGITMTGKAWEINAKLKEYRKRYRTIYEWQRSLRMRN